VSLYVLLLLLLLLLLLRKVVEGVGTARRRHEVVLCGKMCKSV
jgi:hypothetical protein